MCTQIWRIRAPLWNRDRRAAVHDQEDLLRGVFEVAFGDAEEAKAMPVVGESSEKSCSKPGLSETEISGGSVERRCSTTASELMASLTMSGRAVDYEPDRTPSPNVKKGATLQGAPTS
jgi:hypothetical protein